MIGSEKVGFDKLKSDLASPVSGIVMSRSRCVVLAFLLHLRARKNELESWPNELAAL